MPSVAEDLGGGGGEVVERESEFRVLGEMFSGGVQKVVLACGKAMFRMNPLYLRGFAQQHHH